MDDLDFWEIALEQIVWMSNCAISGKMRQKGKLVRFFFGRKLVEIFVYFSRNLIMQKVQK